MDSLFKKEVGILKPILDSICDAQFDSVVNYTADSIMSERQSEIEKYLDRLKKEQLENKERWNNKLTFLGELFFSLTRQKTQA